MFKTDFGSVIKLAEVPYPTVCEVYENRRRHGLWEGANVGDWIKQILSDRDISFEMKHKVLSPENWYYYIVNIDSVDHWYSIAKKDGRIWVVAEDVNS